MKIESHKTLDLDIPYYEKPYSCSLPTISAAFGQWLTMSGGTKMTTALFNRAIHYCDIIETGNDSWRFKNQD